MIGAVGNQGLASQAAVARGAGKRADAVGQQAKSLVAVAREAGPDLPRNAQGLAASAVARGIDPASLFAARVADPSIEPAAPDVPPVAETGGPAADAGAEVVAGATSEIAMAERFSVIKDLVVSEDPSLALLIGEESGAEEEG